MSKDSPKRQVASEEKGGSQPLEELMARGIQLHELAVDGDHEASREAFRLFQEVCALNPNDNMARAYFGSSLTLLGRDGTDPQEQFANTLEGLRILDEAFEAEPDNTGIRILRAYVSYRLPELYFHRTSIAIEDFNYLISRYEKGDNEISQSLYWDLLYNLGCAYRNIGEEKKALATWRKLLSLDPDLEYYRRLRAEGVVEFADDPELQKEKKLLLQEGLRLHQLAEAGDPSAAQKAYELFQKAVAKYPEEFLFEAYCGSSLSLIGRWSTDGSTFFTNGIQGIRMVEKAVQKAPDDIRVRLVRANHSYRLPEAFFHRTATAITDFEYIVQRCEKGNDTLSPSEYQEILYKLGDSYSRLGMDQEAKSAWGKLLALDPDSKYREVIAKKLGEKKVEDLELAEAPQTLQDLVQEGVHLHYLGVEGSMQASEKACEFLKKAHEMDQTDPLIQAYYASSIGLVGRNSGQPSQMFSSAIQGLMTMKAAVQMDPDNPEIRLLRGYFCYHLPEAFFHVTRTAIEDFEFVRGWYKEATRDGRPGRLRYRTISSQQFSQLLYSLFLAYRRLSEKEKAEAVWRELLEYAPDAKCPGTNV